MKVGADSLRANYAGNDPDVAVRNNREAAMGTSLAAPSALAVIQKIVDSLHVSAALALKGVKLAVSRNANHEFIQSEAFTYVQGIRDGTIDTTVVNRQGTYSSTFTDPISVTTSLCSWTGSITATFSVTITGGDGSSSSPYTGTMSLAGTVSTQVTQGGDNCADYSGQVTQSGTVSGTDPTVSGSVTSGLAMAFNGTFSSDGLTGTVTLNSPGYWLVPVVLNVNL
jgi:hypothetical protein